MRYIVKVLDNVHNINSFDEVDEILLTRGNQSELFFRLMSVSGSRKQRYIPQGTSVKVEVQFDNLDQNFFIRRSGVEAFPGDTSVWKLPILPQDQLMFNSMRVVLFEDSKKTTFFVETDIATEDTGDRKRFT